MQKFKSRYTNNNGNRSTVGVEIVLPLKYLSNFSLEMPLLNCKVTLDPTWSENCVICKADRVTE